MDIDTRINESAFALATQAFLKTVQAKTADPVAFADFVNQAEVKNEFWLAKARDKIVKTVNEIVEKELMCRFCSGSGRTGGNLACNKCAGTGRMQ